MLGIQGDDGQAVECCRHRIVILRHVLMHELLHNRRTVTGHQAVILCIADGIVDRSPQGIEPRTVKHLREVALAGKVSKLGQLLVIGNILPQRVVCTGHGCISRHRVVV